MAQFGARVAVWIALPLWGLAACDAGTSTEETSETSELDRDDPNAATDDAQIGGARPTTHGDSCVPPEPTSCHAHDCPTRDYICTSAPNTDWLTHPYQFFSYKEGCGYFLFDHSDDVGAGTVTIKNGRTEEVVYQQTTSFERSEDGRLVPVIVETGCRPDCPMHSLDCSAIDEQHSAGIGEGGFGGGQ